MFTVKCVEVGEYVIGNQKGQLLTFGGKIADEQNEPAKFRNEYQATQFLHFYSKSNFREEEYRTLQQQHYDKTASVLRKYFKLTKSQQESIQEMLSTKAMIKDSEMILRKLFHCE